LDWVVEHNGEYTTAPSTSPENAFVVPEDTQTVEVKAEQVYDFDATAQGDVLAEINKKLPERKTCAVATGSAMDLSRMDVHFMRPYQGWCELYGDLFSAITLLEKERIKETFRKVYPDFATLCGKENNAARSVKMALQWHWGSSLMRKADGTTGMFEMIRSNDLAVRSNLRTDSTLLTAAFFAAAGKKMRDEKLFKAGCNLADFLLRRKIQSPEGFFRWFDHSSMVYFSDCSRSALAMIHLYKTTGIRRYLDWNRQQADVRDYFSDAANILRSKGIVHRVKVSGDRGG
jgi:hypothetical protein